jgi:hypothetical protein
MSFQLELRLAFIIHGLLWIQPAYGQLVIPTAPTDPDYAPMVRIKQAPLSWTYQVRGLEFETCKLASIEMADQDGVAANEATIKLYDADGVELTTQGAADSSCVKTVVDWTPSYSYEIVGGTIMLQSLPSSDLRMWVVAVPDVPANLGGSKVMTYNFNLRYLTQLLMRVDGRTSKRLNATGSPTFANRIRLILKSPVSGLKHKIQQTFEVYLQ